MNEKDIQLALVISSEIEVDGTPSVYLLSAKYTNLVRLNLVLLKAFLDEKRMKGIMITIDRPHQYVSHLLQLHGIDQSNLTFMDAISTHASDTKGGAVGTELRSGPFQIETVPDFLFAADGPVRDTFVDMSRVEFIIIDNVSTLLTYNTMKNVQKFFGRYLELVAVQKQMKVSTALVMDKELHGGLYGFMTGLSRKVIDVGLDMTIKHVATPGPPSTPVDRPVNQQVPNLREVDFGIIKDRDVV